MDELKAALGALTDRDSHTDWRAVLIGAADVLRAGGVVAYPSETVWGLAAHPARPDGLRRLYAVKGRQADRPVQVSCLNLGVARALLRPDVAFEALSAFLPGPLTIVTPASADCPADLAPGGRVGVRVPDHPVARALLACVGGVLATTSCNPSGQPPASDWAAARAMGLGDLVLPDAGVPARGVPSTVLLLPERRVLREGAVETQALLSTLSRVQS